MAKLVFLIGVSKKIFTKNHILTFLFVFVLVIAFLVAYYYYTKYQDSKQSQDNVTSQTEAEIDRLKEKIGALIELPKGEEPIPATVSDVTKLKDQTFFAKAKNGDKVLVYSKAKLAILYRPSVDKIINVAPVNLGDSQTATPSSVQAQKAYDIVLYNGTTTVGLTTKVRDTLYSKTKEFNVVDRDNAFSNTYSNTLVIDFIGNSAVAKNLADFVKGRVASLPDGEKKPENADFLVILGADQN